MTRNQRPDSNDLVNAFINLLPRRGEFFASLLGRLVNRGFKYSMFFEGEDAAIDVNSLFLGLPETLGELGDVIRSHAAPRGSVEARFGNFKIFEFRYWADWKSELSLINPAKLSEKIPLFEIGRAVSVAVNPSDLIGFIESIIELFDGVEPNLYKYHFKIAGKLMFESVWDEKGFKAEIYTARPLLNYIFALARKVQPIQIRAIKPFDVLQIFSEMAGAIREIGRLLESKGKRIVAFGNGAKVLALGAGAKPNVGPMFGPLELYIDKLLALL